MPGVLPIVLALTTVGAAVQATIYIHTFTGVYGDRPQDAS